MATPPRNKLNTVVNVSILATLLILLIGPTGPLPRWYEDWRASRADRSRVLASWDDLISQANILTNGSEPADTVVEFVDYECPFCREAEPALNNAVANGLAIAVLNLPLESIHLHARAAAAAAVCSEEWGKFHAVHRALLGTAGWQEGLGWRQFARENGIPDPEAFAACVASDGTAGRIEEHLALAARLGVTGTPTFVTAAGIQVGVAGLESVLSRVGTVNQQDSYELGDFIFESVRFPHEGVSAIGRLSGGLFLGSGRIVLADGMAANLFFLDLASGRVTTAGRRGDGPGEFRGIRSIGRVSPNGIFVDDPVAARVTVFAPDGSLVETVSYNPLSFRGGVMVPQPIAMNADGVVVFRDADPMFTERPDGPYRERISYLALEPDGSRATITDTHGRQMVRRNYGSSFNSLERPFSYTSLAARFRDLLLVADTESGNVAAYDQTGDAVMTFDIGRGPPVSDEADAMWREERIARARQGNRGNVPADAPAGVSELLSGLGGATQEEEDFYREADGNTTAPALARMFVDADGRVWMQRYPLPGAGAAVWEAWRLGNERTEVLSLRLPSEYELIDALGNRVLLSARGEFDVPRAVIASLQATR